MIRKLINNPAEVVPELLEGAVLASQGKIKTAGPIGALVKTEIPRNKVALLMGGGSGHEPLFPGFIGENLGDGAACGHIFAAPTPDVILATTQAVHRGQGVLYLYGNYSGDNMNFDIAAEMAAEEGIATRTVRCWDDVTSAPPDRKTDRRGIAGYMFVLKVTGAAAAVLPSLDALAEVALKARDNTRSIGVALAAGSIPETGARTFELGDDEIEIGMGLHGEPGVKRQKLAPADEVVAQMLNHLLPDLPFSAGDKVCLLINNLGSTTWLERFIVNRCVRRILAEKRIEVYDTIIGSYCTCQEMAGLSISLMKLDRELQRYYDMPCKSMAFTRS